PEPARRRLLQLAGCAAVLGQGLLGSAHRAPDARRTAQARVLRAAGEPGRRPSQRLKTGLFERRIVVVAPEVAIPERKRKCLPGPDYCQPARSSWSSCRSLSICCCANRARSPKRSAAADPG